LKPYTELEAIVPVPSGKTGPAPDFAEIDATIDRSVAELAAAPGSAAEPKVQAVSAATAESRSRLHWFIGTSDANPPDPGALTYEPQFGLREKPFSLSSDPRFFFSHASHGVAFDTLAAGIRRREGILALMGEVGTGKTTLCRAVLQALDRRTFAAFVPDPFLSREDLLKTLLVDFGVVSVDEIRSGRLRGASRTDLSYPLYDFLASLEPLKAFAVVMIDEAHNLTSDLLEEIRILSDLEKNRQKLLEVMLIAQPELQSRLASTEMRQLSQRVAVRSELVPMTPDEVKAYIAHRLTVAGNDGRVRFTDAAVECVATASNGIPRVVNLTCDRALLRAASSGTSIVNAEHVVWAATDLQMPTSRITEPSLLSQPAALPVPTPVEPVELQSESPLPVVELVQPLEQPIEASAPEVETATSVITDVMTPPQAIVQSSAAAPWPWKKWLGVTAACLVLAAAAGTLLTQYSLDRLMQKQPSAVAPPAAPAASPAQAATTAQPQSSPQPETVSVATPKVALQMATFQSAARAEQAMQELRNAGYRAYSVELPPRDGERVLAVLVGPYTDRAPAERDLGTTRQLPGYASARLIDLGPALLPPAAQPN
jgi:type II secretory pathway predicted ATPase ExeA/cell division septation protein DedD